MADKMFLYCSLLLSTLNHTVRLYHFLSVLFFCFKPVVHQDLMNFESRLYSCNYGDNFLSDVKKQTEKEQTKADVVCSPVENSPVVDFTLLSLQLTVYNLVLWFSVFFKQVLSKISNVHSK